MGRNNEETYDKKNLNVKIKLKRLTTAGTNRGYIHTLLIWFYSQFSFPYVIFEELEKHMKRKIKGVRRPSKNDFLPPTIETIQKPLTVSDENEFIIKGHLIGWSD